uniref:Chalcone-flavonone isomerase family protein n=1 Tax=Anthurium amnicola TaxID=1678845 RepID=A0A1D1Y9R6_9ARAE
MALGGVGAVMWSASSPARVRPSCCSSSSTVGAGHTHLAVLNGSPGAGAAVGSPSSVLSLRSGGRSPVLRRKRANWAHLLPRAASVGSAEYTVEPATGVKFQRLMQVPGCSTSLHLLGTGYREKVFAIIGVKVYAAGFYAHRSMAEMLHEWKGKPATEILDDSTLFKSILQDSREKSLKIVLVRDVDGQTFWNALNDVISPRIKEPSATDETALSTFRNTFEGRPLKQGNIILLTWVEPSKMLVSISSDGSPAAVDAVIQSISVTFALFDAFFGPTPVSPTLKSSVADGLAMLFDH